MKTLRGPLARLLNDLDKEVVLADIKDWVVARLPAIQTESVAPKVVAQV